MQCLVIQVVPVERVNNPLRQRLRNIMDPRYRATVDIDSRGHTLVLLLGLRDRNSYDKDD